MGNCCMLKTRASSDVQQHERQNSESEEELSYEMVKTEIAASLQYLKNCDDYSTEEARIQLDKLSDASGICDSFDSDVRRELADFLINEGFAQLFVKIVSSLHDDGRNGYGDDGNKEQCLGDIKSACINLTNGLDFSACQLELIQHGAVDLLLKGLNASNDIETGSKLISTIDILNILENCIDCPDSIIVRATFRKANAVPILMRYLKSHEMLVIMTSLSILAHIVNDDECGILSSTEGCIEHLVTSLDQAVSSEDCRVRYKIAGETYYDGVYGLIDTMNHLAVNDCNKREIVKRGGIPIIIRIITDDTDLGFQEAIETLWKLAFIKDHQKTLTTNLKDANAIQGNCE